MNIEEDYSHIYIISGGPPMVQVPVPYIDNKRKPALS